jgi:hypothetical protein
MKALTAGSTLDNIILAAARAGYAARGFVYVSIGVLAVLAALDRGGSARGSLGAMEPLAQAPLGELWLILVGLGLICFASWRAMQSLFDADRQGRRPKALLQRVGQGVSGLIYAALGVFLELVDELEDMAEGDEEQRADSQAAQLLSLPFGDILLLAVGLFIIGAGVANIFHGVEKRFHSDLDCSEALRRFAKPMGRAGYICRGVAFLTVGAYLAQAGLDARSSEARGLGGALQSLEQSHGGPMVLLVVAVGLVAFGLFGMVEARYRALRAPDDFKP